MRSKSLSPAVPIALKGLSLMELGITMVIVSLALVPLVKLVGGPSSQNGNGNAAQVGGIKNKEVILANTMLNKVLAGDYSSIKCGATFSPTTDFPSNSTPKTFAKCTSSSGNNTLYYTWTLLDLNAVNSAGANASELPSNNHYYQGVLNITNNDNVQSASLPPLLTMSVNFFRNDGKPVDDQTLSTGVEIAIDRSTSMAWSNVGSNLPNRSNYAVPFMFYRYDKNLFTGNSWGMNFPAGVTNAFLNRWDDSQLDIVYAKQINGAGFAAGEDPDKGTANNESFPFAIAAPSVWGQGVLGTGNCNVAGNSNKWDHTSGAVDKNLIYTFIPWVRDNPTFNPNTGPNIDMIDDVIRPLCSEKAAAGANNWSNTINKKLSRYEAARTSALSLLLKLEEQPSVRDSIEMGFFPWGSYAATEHEALLQAAERKPGQPADDKGFLDVRERLLWLNRANPQNASDNALPIRMEGGTHIQRGLELARQRLTAKKYDRRIIVLLTDGAPNPNIGQNSNAAKGGGGLRDYTRNNLGCGVAKDDRITLFTVGLIAADNAMLGDMANATPSGQNFPANDISSLKPIFDTIAYQIQKLSLLTTASRYNLALSETDECDGK